MAVALIGVGAIGVNCPSGHLTLPESWKQPELRASPFVREKFANYFDTRENEDGQFSIHGAVQMSGAIVSGAIGYINGTAFSYELTYKFGTARGEQIVSVYTSNLIRLFDIVPKSDNRLECYGRTSTSTPISVTYSGGTGHQYSANDEVTIQFTLDMETGDISITVRNQSTYALIETITATGADIGDFDGGTLFGLVFVGRKLDRGVGDTAGYFGENRFITTGGYVARGTRTYWLPGTTAVSGAQWTDFGGGSLEFPDGRGGDDGSGKRHAAGAGTGAGSVLSRSLPSITGTPLNLSGITIYGVTVMLKGWCDTASSAARFELGVRYDGVDYWPWSGGTAQMNPRVQLTGGTPHTRRIGLYTESAGSYLGPDGLAWTAAKIAAMRILVRVTNDTDAINITYLGVGVTFTDLQTVTPTLTKDAVMDKASSGTDGGLVTTLEIRANAGGTTGKRSCLQFTHSIPTGAEVTTATLSVNQTAGAAQPNLPFEIDRMTQTGWIEGTGAGDGTTWDEYQGGVSAWATPGGDFTRTGNSTGVLSQATGVIAYDATTVSQSDVTAGTAFTWLLRRYDTGTPANDHNGTAGGVTFESREGTTDPALSVTYLTAPPSMAITAPTEPTESTGGAVTFSGTSAGTNGATIASVVWQDQHGNSGTATGTTSWTFDYTPPAGGIAYAVTVTAIDSNGNTASVTEFVASVETRLLGPDPFTPPTTETVLTPYAETADISAFNPFPYGTEEFWQIINDNGLCATAGPIWSFTTEANPNPPRGGLDAHGHRNRIRPFRRDLTGFGFSQAAGDTGQ